MTINNLNQLYKVKIKKNAGYVVISKNKNDLKN